MSLARTAMWIQSLPRVSEVAAPSGLDLGILRAHEIEMDTAWGRLTRLGPVLRMSETPEISRRTPREDGPHPAAGWLQGSAEDSVAPPSM